MRCAFGFNWEFAISMLAMAVVHVFAVMSPGANFLIVARNSLTYSRQTGLMTVRGVALGSLMYITIGILGFATVISQSPPIFNAIKLLGAGYFFYTGVKALLSLRKPSRLAQQIEAQPSLTRRQAFFSGLLTAVSNATSALYFLALFTTFVPTSSSWQEKVFTALLLISITFTWYTFLALTLSRNRVRQFYRRFERWLNGLIGFLWIFLALKLLGGFVTGAKAFQSRTCIKSIKQNKEELMPLVKCRTLFNQTKFVPAETMIHRPSVYGIVLDAQRVLVGKAKSTQKYVLPGGGIEKGEATVDALKREMREETGLEVEVGEFLHFETDFFYYDPLEMAIHGFLFFYRCTSITTELSSIEYPLEEDLELPLWVEFDQLSADSFQAHGERTLRLIKRCLVTSE